MPVTIYPAPGHAARRWDGKAVHSSEDLLKGACPTDHKKCKSIIQCSFGFDEDATFSPHRNGFVHAAIDAYSSHHNLIIRPEDVWFAILSQLSLYINAHAEELRSFFVAHEGQKELVIVYYHGSIHTIDMGGFAQEMSDLLSKNVNDPDLHPWIMPAFSTTTNQDRVVASVMMMGALQKYFSYGMSILCAIPSVTLLGEKSDWENILQRIEKLQQLGEEPTRFYDSLKPVVGRFVDSFTSPESEPTRDFWQSIADAKHGSGVTWISGWITAFCFWNQDGKMIYHNRSGGKRAGCVLDEIRYHQVEIKSIASGCTSVPLTIDDNGTIYNTIMVAGSAGVRVTSSGKMLDDSKGHKGGYWYDDEGRKVPKEYEPPIPAGEPGLDCLQPESGWWMYETTEEPKAADDKGKTLVRDAD